MESKDWIAIIGIGVTFLISCANFLYSVVNSRRTMFVNTVTTSRLKWIDSLRDKVSEFISVTVRLVDTTTGIGNENRGTLLLERDTLLHQIVLHLNPNDEEDQRIKDIADHVKELTTQELASQDLTHALLGLRDATSAYLKKEWNRVKKESMGRTS